jgi:hypothetical protein
LPAIELKWWDASSQQTRTAQVPAVSFDAAANSAYRPVFSISEDLKAARPAPSCAFRALPWACGWRCSSVGAAYWMPLCPSRVPQAKARRQARHSAWLASADYAWRQIPAQLEGNRHN